MKALPANVLQLNCSRYMHQDELQSWCMCMASMIVITVAHRMNACYLCAVCAKIFQDFETSKLFQRVSSWHCLVQQIPLQLECGSSYYECKLLPAARLKFPQHDLGRFDGNENNIPGDCDQHSPVLRPVNHGLFFDLASMLSSNLELCHEAQQVTSQLDILIALTEKISTCQFWGIVTSALLRHLSVSRPVQHGPTVALAPC